MVISRACFFLFVNTVKSHGASIKVFLHQRKLRATSSWDEPLRVQGNWPDQPPCTGVNFQPWKGLSFFSLPPKPQTSSNTGYLSVFSLPPKLQNANLIYNFSFKNNTLNLQLCNIIFLINTDILNSEQSSLQYNF